MTNERPDLDEAFGISTPSAVAERPDLDEAFGLSKPAAVERPDLDEAFGVSQEPVPRPLTGDMRQEDEQRVAAQQTPPTPTIGDRNAERGYRELVSKFLGGGGAKRLAGSEEGVYQSAKDELNALNDVKEGVSQVLHESGGDIDKAIALSRSKAKAAAPKAPSFMDAFGMASGGADYGARESAKGTIVSKFGEPAAKRLEELKASMDEAGVPASERPRIIQDTAKATAWTEKDADNIRKLSTGELVINPGRVFGQRDKLIAEINASDTTPEDKTAAIERLDALRAASAEKLANDLHYGDVRLPGAQEFRDFASARPDKPTTEVLDEWITKQKDRGLGWKMIDGLMAGVAKGELGIAKTVVGGLAGAAALTGAPGAETLGQTQQLLSATRDSAAQAEKLRGADGITNDLADTITQMAPMFAGAGAAQGLAGVSKAAVQGMSVYGWAAAQGYESKLDDAVRMAREAKGSELTPQEVTNVLGDRKTQLAAFANGAQTAILSKVLGGGVERAALGQAAKSMTVRDLVAKGGMAALRDKGLKKELGAMAKTVLTDASDEAVEEFTNQVLDDAISTVALGKDMKLGDLMEESLKAGALGGLVGGVIPQIRRTSPDPAIEASRDLVAAAAPEAPQSAAAALETPAGAVIGTDGNPIVPDVVDPASGLTLDSKAQAALNETSTQELTTASESQGVESPDGTLQEAPSTLTNETPNLEVPAVDTPAPPIAEAPQEAVPEGVPAVEVQPTSGGPAVAGSEGEVVRNPDKTTQQTPSEYAQWSSENGREQVAPEKVQELHKAEIKDVIREELDTEKANEDAGLGFIGPQYPLSAEAVDAYGIKLPEGYVRQGDLYVYQPTQTPNVPNPQRQEGTPAETAQPAPAEAGASGGVAPGDGGTASATQETGGEVARDAAKAVAEFQNDDAVPDGWYIHGRNSKDNLDTGNVIQLTTQPDVARQYAGKKGSVWLIRPKSSEDVADMTDGVWPRKAAEALFEDYENRVISPALDAEIRSALDSSDGDTEQAIEMLASEFNPEEIVTSAEAWDSRDRAAWFYDRFEKGFVETNNGAVVLDRDSVESVRADGPLTSTPEFGNPPVDPNTPEPLDPNPPTPELPNFEAALADDSVTGLYHAQTDADRARLGLPPRFKQPRTTDQEAWDRATAAEDAHRAAGKPGTAGTDLLTNLLNDAPRVLTKDEHALLLHEKLVREQAVEKTQERLNNLASTTPEGERKDVQAAVQKAQNDFDLLVTYADAAGSRAGLSLQARKMLVNTDFSLAAVVNRLKAAKNMNSDAPVAWTAKDQAAAVEIATKLQQAQERIETLEAGNDAQTALIEQLTRDVERAQTKLENRMRTSRARTLVNEKLNPLVEAAKARMAARKGQTPPSDTTTLHSGLGPEQLEDLKDIGIIAAGWIANKALTLEEFSRKLTGEFGDWVAEHAQNLFRQARSLYIETAESVTAGNSPTPASVIEGIDATEPLDKTDVWKLARAYVVSGLRGRNVLDAVFGDLSQVFPNLTREEVSDAFTGYGTVVYPSDKEVPKELRRIRSLEREYAKQADIAAGLMPKRTGLQRGGKPTTEEEVKAQAELREEQKKTKEALRELENQMREAGIPIPSDEKKLANAEEIAQTKLKNEIAELQLAIDTNTPRTPSTRTPIKRSEEVQKLKAQLKLKQQEYVKAGLDAANREKRILGSLKKRIEELERRMRDKDFSKPPVKEPVDSEALKKAEFAFEKTRARYEEMRNTYLLDNASRAKQVGHALKSSSNFLKMSVLGLDLGTTFRQLGTTFASMTRDLGMFAPTKHGEKLRKDGSYLKRVFSAGAKAFVNEEKFHEEYERLKTRELSGWDKLGKMVFVSPFDSRTNSKEDIPVSDWFEKLPWYVWPVVAGVKVSLLGSSAPVAASLIALGAVTKPLSLALNRAQQAMTNESRALFFDAAIRNINDGHPSTEAVRAIGKGVMVMTGRGTAPQKLEGAIPFLNHILISTRYYLSRMQAAFLYPLWNSDARKSKEARKEIQKFYAMSVSGRAIMYGLAALAFGKSLAGDDDEPEEGLKLNPIHRKFGSLKLAEGVSTDFMSSTNQYLGLVARMAPTWMGGHAAIDPKTGSYEALGGGFTKNVLSEAKNFLQSKVNIQLSLVASLMEGQFYGGKPVTPGNVMDEITSAIIINDTINTYQVMMDEYGPVEGAAKATAFLGLMFGGAGTSVRDSVLQKEINDQAKREAEADRKIRQAELNE